jgi:hypothetical protein
MPADAALTRFRSRARRVRLGPDCLVSEVIALDPDVSVDTIRGPTAARS